MRSWAQLLQRGLDTGIARVRIQSARRHRARRVLRRGHSAAEVPANDYPTVARADYVFGCMQVNGQTRDALERCSCSIDVIASLLPIDQYEEAETVMRVRQRGGKNASMFLSMPMLRDKVDELKRAQVEAELRCF